MKPALGIPVKSRYVYEEPEYIKLLLENGRVLAEHRYLMTQHLGRELSRREHVHHVNGHRHDNRIENLNVLSDRVHASHHHKPKTMVEKTCEWCGKKFEIELRQTYKKGAGRFCSRPCIGYAIGTGRSS